MNLLHNTKWFNAIPPGVIKDDAAWVSYVLDKQTLVDQDAKGVLFAIGLGATDVAAAVLKVMQSDTETNETTLGGTPTAVHDVTTKPGAGDDNGVWLVYVPMSSWTEQYLQLQGTAGDGTAGTYLSALAVIDSPGAGGATAALLGATVVEIAA
jgi:hypothetical protein